MDKKTLLIAQLIMTFMMAVCMSGIMSVLILGPSWLWFTTWMRQILVAWPIAFLCTQVVSRIAFPLAHKIRARLA